MEFIEEILRRADFSAETDFKERFRQQVLSRDPASVRDISLEELMRKHGIDPNPVKPSKRQAAMAAEKSRKTEIAPDVPRIEAPLEKLPPVKDKPGRGMF
ncbi:MAG: hypothetical protein K6G16_01540 [Lachnospiraceae bacterium]|nr:hypothetical protein [Lachnospiraceae bacterium]